MRPTIADVALVFGGSTEVFAEYEAALDLCAKHNLTTAMFVCNSAMKVFPGPIEYGVTLHPDQLYTWLPVRKAAGFPPPDVIWAHRHALNVTKVSSRDWGGSVGLFAARCARQEGFTKVILCGCPMNVEDCHFLRPGQRWNAATAFRRGWISHRTKLPPECIRSMSGWTQEQFGAPDDEWLLRPIDVPPFRFSSPSLRA